MINRQFITSDMATRRVKPEEKRSGIFFNFRNFFGIVWERSAGFYH